jgi:4-amino-4-deoxy-L-arabinose transferase-like glycosyltransferase
MIGWFLKLKQQALNMDKRKYFFVILLVFVTFFANNSALPTDIMESRNIVTAREIVKEGNWLVPTMNGELRLEKPPLPTWVGAAVEILCPNSLSAQRCAAALMGIVWVAFLFLLVRFFTQDIDFSLLVTIVFLTMYQVVLMGRTATWDIYCHAFMMGAIYFLVRGVTDENRYQWQWFPLAGLFMGLSFLSKGPVAFYALLLPAIIAGLFYKRPSLKGKWGGILLMVLLAIVIGGWWYLYLLTFEPTAVKAVMAKESGNWSSHNTRPWFYYWRFFTETGIWTVLMAASLFYPYWKSRTKQPHVYGFFMVWTLSALVLLSFMPEKKFRYLLPMMAPCAVCVAYMLMTCAKGDDKWEKIVYKCNGYLIGVLSIGAGFAISITGILHNEWNTVCSCLLFIITGIWLFIATRKKRPFRLAVGVGMLFMVAECFCLKAIGNVFSNPHQYSISHVNEKSIVKDVPFYHPAREEMRIELVYEANRKILPLDVESSKIVLTHLPLALVSHHAASCYLSPSLLRQVDTLHIATYDDNKHPLKDKHYTQDFINHVTLITKKNYKIQ